MKSLKSQTYWRVQSTSDRVGRRILTIACGPSRRVNARRVAGRYSRVLRLTVHVIAEDYFGFEPVIRVLSTPVKPEPQKL